MHRVKEAGIAAMGDTLIINPAREAFTIETSTQFGPSIMAAGPRSAGFSRSSVRLSNDRIGAR